MLVVALGRASIEAGYRTYYATAADLVARCHRAALEGRGFFRSMVSTMGILSGASHLMRESVKPDEAQGIKFRRDQTRYHGIPRSRTVSPLWRHGNTDFTEPEGRRAQRPFLTVRSWMPTRANRS
jgi:hypothetical protein